MYACVYVCQTINVENLDIRSSLLFIRYARDLAIPTLELEHDYNCRDSERIRSLRGDGKFHASYMCPYVQTRKALNARRVAYEYSTAYST